MPIPHEIQRGQVTITEGDTRVRFDMPNGEVLHVDIFGTCDPRINAAYAHLFAKISLLMEFPVQELNSVGFMCDVELS